MGVATDKTIKDLRNAVSGIDTSGLMTDVTGQNIVTAINNIGSAISPSASNVSYNNTSSGLTASNVQSAIDEIDGIITDTNRYKTWSKTSSTTLTNTTNTTIIGDMILEAGVYIITAVAGWAYSPQGVRRIFIGNSDTSTGALNNARNSISANTDANQSALDNCITMIFNFTSSITLFLRAFQSSGGNLNVINARVSAFKLL